jgi:protein O-GlcNAcase/histone acetyltransferase
MGWHHHAVPDDLSPRRVCFGLPFPTNFFGRLPNRLCAFNLHATTDKVSHAQPSEFLAGVIEGFYGPPWNRAERFELFDWLHECGLNSYLYAPKDDLKHRALWREPYTASEAEPLRELILGCRQRGVRFIYALSPGLDIRFSSDDDFNCLTRRFEQMFGLGCEHFAILFDDIPDRLAPADDARFGSPSAAQAHVANALFRWTQERHPGALFLFCPTAYCGRMAAGGLGGPNYLLDLGRSLLPDIQVFWTGPDIVSREITLAHVEEIEGVLRRKPLIWDNLHANDYDGRRFYCGPYSGRPVELKAEVRGLLCNPNCEFPLNFVPIRTFGEFVKSEAPWDARAAYLAALRQWFPRFSTCRERVSFEDLTLLGDCYYLPYEAGDLAEKFYARARSLLSRPPAAWGEDAQPFRHDAARLRDICARLADLLDRPLFYALSRRIWELREEMDLLDRFVLFHTLPEAERSQRISDFHLPRTYRGGFVANLQRLLVQQPDGTFIPAGQTQAASTCAS